MKIISGMFKSIYHVLGHQRYDPAESYKVSPYLVTDRQDDGTLMCNTLTREIIWVSDGETDMQKFLVEHWYLILESADPWTICYLFMQQHRTRYGPRPAEGLQLVTILTTTDCNARCWYCYEAGCRKRRMTPEKALDVARFIENRCSHQNLTLKWFGGEPLCNAEAINIICQYLQDRGITYKSMMVTNGLLLDQHSIEQMTQFWRLSTVQITLDGTKTEYERIKGYAVSDAYERVLGNIEILLKIGIHVDIRLNLSLENYEDLEKLIEDLADRFGSYGGGLFTVYPHTLFEGDGFSPADTDQKRLYAQVISLQQILKCSGIGKRTGLPKIAHTHCMADDGNSVVVMPGGELGLCEHHCDDEYIGTIYDTEWDQEVIQRWQETGVEGAECTECFWRPACNRLKHCPGKTPYTDAWRGYLEERVKMTMRNAYERCARKGGTPCTK